jgi:serine/threonine protein kinase
MRCLNCGQNNIDISIIVCPKCGIHIPSLMRDTLPTGTALRNKAYRIGYPIGKGGFGITYRGMNSYFQKVVAIKEYYPNEQVFRDSNTGSITINNGCRESYQKGLQRFIREGRILANINHPNVVGVQDLFEEQDTAYLVMEFVEGNTLKDILKAQKRLTFTQIQTILQQLVNALDTVHQGEIYHLDLKPDNILLTSENRLVLVDFGAARQGFSSYTTQAFTLDYAAPEIIAGQDVGPESDIFEVGMILHELLTGNLPPRPLSRLIKDDWKPEGLSEPWSSLLIQALTINKADRPKNIRKWWERDIKVGISRKEVTPISSPVTTETSEKSEIVTLIEQAFIGTKLSPKPKTINPSNSPDLKEQLDKLFG